jgi:hypothetical protein
MVLKKDDISWIEDDFVEVSTPTSFYRFRNLNISMVTTVCLR